MRDILGMSCLISPLQASLASTIESIERWRIISGFDSILPLFSMQKILILTFCLRSASQILIEKPLDLKILSALSSIAKVISSILRPLKF